MLRLTTAAGFLLLGAAAFLGWSAPAAPKKGGGISSGATKAKARGKSAAATTAKGSKKSASAASARRRTVGRRSTRRRRSDHYAFVGQQRPAPERIQEIEQALASKGFFSNPPDTVWDDSTIDALRRFQQSQNLTADGKLSSLSLIALGLGPRATALPQSTTTPAPAPAAAPPPPQQPQPQPATPPEKSP